MDSIRVLVTGAGSGVGQGIIKALRISDLPMTIIGADISLFSSGLFVTDEALMIPKVEESGSLEQMISIISKNRIDIVMIGSEFDLEFFAANREIVQKETGSFLVVSHVNTVKLADDKWLTAEFLRQNNLPYSESFVATNVGEACAKAEEWRYPIVLKTRTGTSNRNVHIVRNQEELTVLFDKVPNPMIQKLIDTPTNYLKSEYTCSVFKDSEGRLLGPFVARRTLRGGSSWVVEVLDVPDLHPMLMSIGTRLEITGSLNVQLMIGPHGPIPFEFNARFSGTTAVRAHFGFNEPAMAIRSFYLNERIESPRIRRGLAFRYLEEVFVEDAKADNLGFPLPIGTVRRWF